MMSNLTKVITGIGRFSYVNVWEPKSINGGDAKYSVSFIIPKSDKATIKKIKTAIEEAKKEGTSKLGRTYLDLCTSNLGTFFLCMEKW